MNKILRLELYVGRDGAAKFWAANLRETECHDCLHVVDGREGSGVKEVEEKRPG